MYMDMDMCVNLLNIKGFYNLETVSVYTVYPDIHISPY